MPRKPAKAPDGDANDRYNAGLRLMGSIEASLRGGGLNASAKKAAAEAERELLAALEA